MKTVVAASENPVKVNVARRAFESVYPEESFEFVALKSDSGVGDQPMNDETEQGALNRLDFIREAKPEADFWISQEGGLYEEGDLLYNRAWLAILDREGYVAKSSTALFYLPKPLSEYVKSGMELGDAADKFFNTVNAKQGKGALGHLTEGLVDRENYYLQAAIIALSELRHKDWYQ